MFLKILPMFVLVAKYFARRRFVAQICGNSGAHAHFAAYLRDKAIPNEIKSFSTNIRTIPINTINMPTNFELKLLKPKLDIFTKKRK